MGLINLKRNKRANKTFIEDLPISKTLESSINDIARSLSKQIDKEIFNKKHARTADVLKIIGTGAFLLASVAIPNLPRVLKPFMTNKDEYEVSKRFNIPYLKRILKRLEREKMVEIKNENNQQVVEITYRGKRRILKYALDELVIEKPKYWDGKWRLVSYDIPKKFTKLRKILRDYLQIWGFYPLHESVYLHAYPCGKQVEFLREYLGLGEYVRVFFVNRIDNDSLFRDFFGV